MFISEYFNVEVSEYGVFDSGRGPVDIKLSRGIDKILAEIKLSSNP
ncbi:MAG: hypothetical protein K6G43_01290 [Lachnospiraceae bacterium]|nr:hypothetical protein [Lachnospiraceae bacterium]